MQIWLLLKADVLAYSLVLNYRWRVGRGATTDLNSVQTEHTSPVGENLIDDVVATNINCKWVKLKDLCTTEGAEEKEKQVM